MRFVIFTHSLVSDWNHGNAHFLRGISTELVKRGHQLRILEPADGWSRLNLLDEYGQRAISDFETAYPMIRSELYDERTLDLDDTLEDANVAIVHEWNSHDLVRRIGAHHRENRGYQLYFHDTHHRSVTDPSAMAAYDLQHYDGVLAYGRVIRDLYQSNGWTSRSWAWHEAADTDHFYPRYSPAKDGDLVWIGNWGDDERTAELREFLIEPVKRLGIKAKVYGVRYPAFALDQLNSAGIEYGGWLPNHLVPQVFSRYRVTVHIPRGPYSKALPGIPTIRPFEALACGIPLVSAPWKDSENLFRTGKDFLSAENGGAMASQLEKVLTDTPRAHDLSGSGLETIYARHTCSHRVDELFRIMACQGQRVNTGAAAFS
jgi:spore maturation protein CgeB